MLYEYFCSESNKHYSAEKLSFGFIFDPENASDFYSRRRAGKGGNADNRDRNDDINFKKRKSYSDGEGINARRNGEHEHRHKRKGGVLVAVLIP